MSNLRGFLKVARQDAEYRNACERVRDYREVSKLRPEKKSQEQALPCIKA